MGEVQEQVQRHIDALVGAGAETGVQVAVYRDGALIVDAVAGAADSSTGRPVTSGTPIFGFSIGKNVRFSRICLSREVPLITTARSRTSGPSSVCTARLRRHCGTC
jgi:hypothetical protein